MQIFADMRRLLLLLTAFAAIPASAQIDAKVLGMGGVAMTAVGTSHPIYNNSAMGFFSPSPSQISSSYQRQDGIDSYAVTGSYLVGFNNLVLAGWSQSFTGENGNSMNLDLGYSRRIGSKWAVGAVVRYNREKLNFPGEELNFNSLAVDLSAAYVLPLNNIGQYSTLRAGAKLSNLGGFIDDLEDNTLPMSIKAGVALDTYITDLHELTVGMDAGYGFNAGPTQGYDLSVGTEYNLMQLIQLRAGYHYNRYDYARFGYGSVGAGVRFLHLRLDFAYLFAKKETPLRNVYNLSFGFDF